MVQDVLEAVKSRSFPKISGGKSLEIIYSGEYMVGIVWHICNNGILHRNRGYFVLFRKYSVAKKKKSQFHYLFAVSSHFSLLYFVT